MTMFRSIRPILILALMAGFLAQPVKAQSSLATSSLDGFISFSDPFLCEPAEGFKDFINSSLDASSSGNGVVLRQPKIPASLTDVFGKTAFEITDDDSTLFVNIKTKVSGTWLGIPVTEIIQPTWVPGVSGNFIIVFRSDIQTVSQALNDAGFAIRPNGTRIYSDDGNYSVYELSVSLVERKERNGEVFFSCSLA